MAHTRAGKFRIEDLKRRVCRRAKTAREKILGDSPCAKCAKDYIYRDDDGQVICPDFRKCSKYKTWFGAAWRDAVRSIRGK